MAIVCGDSQRQRGVQVAFKALLHQRSRGAPGSHVQRPAVAPSSNFLGYVAYPLLLLSAGVIAAVAIQWQFDLPLVNFSFVVGTIGYLALLERLIPYDRAWFPEAWEWRRDGLYYLMTMVVGGTVRAAVLGVSIVVAPSCTSLPLWVEIPVAVLVLSLCSYLYHRLSHRVPWLWKAHGIHHVPGKVNVSNNNVNQFVDVFIHLLVTQLALLLAGLSQPAVFVAMMFKAAQGYGIHANIKVKLGWLNYIIVTPEQHRLHHSRDSREAGHYGADLPIWDLLFGSFTWAPNRAPASVGVQEPALFPPARSILASQVHPFRRCRAEPSDRD